MSEPWCMLPEDLAKLTDHQILYCYIHPQIARSEAIKNGTELPPIEDEVESDEPMNRQLLMSMMVQFGMRKEAAAAEYDRQLVAWAKRKQEGV